MSSLIVHRLGVEAHKPVGEGVVVGDLEQTLAQALDPVQGPVQRFEVEPPLPEPVLAPSLFPSHNPVDFEPACAACQCPVFVDCPLSFCAD